MKSDTGEDIWFYIRFVYVLSHIYCTPKHFSDSTCFPKYSVRISPKKFRHNWEIIAAWKNVIRQLWGLANILKNNIIYI